MPAGLAKKYPHLTNLIVSLWVKDNPDMVVHGWLGAEGFKITQGYAGLTEVARPRRVSMVQYSGAPPLHMTGEIIFDTWTWTADETGERMVEPDVYMLEQMAGLDPKHVQPYELTISGKGIPHQDIPWYIWDLTWGDNIMRNTEGQLKRQDVKLELVEAVTVGYVRPIEEPEESKPPIKHGHLVRTPKNKKYLGYWITKKGDTLQYIAKVCYGKNKIRWWKKIALANGLANPARVPVGIKLKIPRIYATGNPYGVVETIGQQEQ